MKTEIDLAEIKTALSLMEWGSDEVLACLTAAYGSDLAAAIIDVMNADYAEELTTEIVDEAKWIAAHPTLYRLAYQGIYGAQEILEDAAVNWFATEVDADAGADRYNTDCPPEPNEDGETHPVYVIEVRTTVERARAARKFFATLA